MPALADTTITAQLLGVLKEALDGPADGWSYFSDAQPDAGLLGSVTTLTPAQASHPVGPSGTSIAAHLHHLAFSLAASAAWIRGDHSSVNWSESWRVHTVTAAEWTALQERTRTTGAELHQAIEQHALATEENFGGSVGALAHAVYHLAAIRQKAAAVRG
jgi:hypothetical protein